MPRDDEICIPKGVYEFDRPRSHVTIVAEHDVMRSDMERAFRPLLKKVKG